MELIANDIVYDDGITRFVVRDELTVFENYEKLFGQKGMQILLYSFQNFGAGNFYLLERYCQFIGLIQYTREPKNISMSIIEIKDIDTFLDVFSKLKMENWKESDLKRVGDIVQEITNDQNKVLASIKIKKLF